MSERPLRIGTRSSRLAVWQALFVKNRLSLTSEIVKIKTSGDRDRRTDFKSFGFQGIFTKELEQALEDGRVDIAVHSFKDMPTVLPDSLVLGAVLPRGPVEDLLVVHPAWASDREPFFVRKDGKVGTSSQRRSALLQALGGMRSVPLRGNLNTRLEALEEGRYAAILVARAGVERLEASVSGLQAYLLDPDHWIPAPAQGALAVEVRRDDMKTREEVARLDCPRTRLETSVERAFMAYYSTGCHAPFGALATASQKVLKVRVGMGSEEQGADSNPWKSALFAVDMDLLDGISTDELVSEPARRILSVLSPVFDTPAPRGPLCVPFSLQGREI